MADHAPRPSFRPEVRHGPEDVEAVIGALGSREVDVVAALRKRDDAANEQLGFSIFPRPGIALSGLEPPEPDQKAVTHFGPEPSLEHALKQDSVNVFEGTIVL